MSFEGFYQMVCKNGHYCECDVYDHREKCIDCFNDLIFENLVDDTNCEQYGYIRIPVSKSGDVDKNFFEKYFSSSEKIEKLKKKKENLVPVYLFDFHKEEYPLEKIVELFQYFDRNKKLRIEFSMQKDQGNDFVPFVYVSFGESNYSEGKEEWHEMYMDEYGQETTKGNGYECCVWSYEWDIRSIVIALYKNMWNRCFAYNLKEK